MNNLAPNEWLQPKIALTQVSYDQCSNKFGLGRSLGLTLRPKFLATNSPILGDFLALGSCLTLGCLPEAILTDFKTEVGQFQYLSRPI